MQVNNEMEFSRIDKARKRLGLPEEATLEEIKTAYRKLSVACHPDRCPAQDIKKCEKAFREITEARNVLLEYCAGYRFSFRKENVETIHTKSSYDTEHMRRFYDEWMSDKPDTV